MANQATELSLTKEDANKLQLSYKTLAGLQRKTLAFLKALEDYDKRRHGRSDKSSRMAFIVTPLMVNHYNHMHHVYRASMYGKVPDLCDQTGGIVCADLGALREELADQTTDVNRSLVTTFNSATIPSLQFDFKTTRDNVLETCLRMLDTIDIKQPDLSHSIRDDYIQNVRAIQESLTNALERARERSAELQSRLDDALRKLNLAEKTMATAPRDAERLRKEVFQLKEQLIDQQHLLLNQRIDDDNRTLDLRHSQTECKLLHDLIEKLKHNSREEAAGIAALRDELFRYTDTELTRLKDDYRKVREDLREYIKTQMDRSNVERQDAVDLCQTLLAGQNGGGGSTAGSDTLHKLRAKRQDENEELKRERALIVTENEDLKRQAARLESENERLRQQLANLKEKTDGNVYEPMDYEDVMDCINHCTAKAEAQSIIQSIVNRYNDLRDCSTYKEHQMKESYSVLKEDLDSLYGFITDPDNVEAAIMLAKYMHGKGIKLYSEYANLLQYLNTLVTSREVAAYISELNQGRAAQAVRESGILEEVAARRSDIEQLNRTIGYSNAVVTELLSAIDEAYGEIVHILDLEKFPKVNVDPQEVTSFFLKRFGPALRNRVMDLVDLVRGSSRRATDCEDEINRLKQRSSEVATRSESHLNVFNGDPTVFENVLQEVWLRPDTDVLKRSLNAAYYALAIDRVRRYETSTDSAELKLYNLIEYTTLTDHIKRTVSEREAVPELANPKLAEEGYFLQHFFTHLGNVQVESYVNRLDLRSRNKLAVILFKEYYIPIMNKAAYVLSIDGPFANFNMVYKV